MHENISLITTIAAALGFGLLLGMLARRRAADRGATLMGMGLSHLWGWSLGAGLVFGLALSVASTVVLPRALEDRALNTAITVSASLAQIGEFSFILAALGMSLGLLPQLGQNLILAGAIISIAVNPLMFKLVAPVQSWLRDHSDAARRLERSSDPLAELPMDVPHERLSGQVVLVGYGRVGRRLAHELAQGGIHVVVAEQNRERVEELGRRGQPAVAGNAAEPALLIQAHVARGDAGDRHARHLPRARDDRDRARAQPRHPLCGAQP